MVASINLLEKLQVVDRLFYVSPSADSNSASLARLGNMLHKEDMYSNVNDVSILGDIVSKIERERDDYEEYHRRLKKWEEAHRKVHSDTPLFQLRDDDLIEASALTGMNRYVELCRSLGGNPSNQRKVAGIIIGEGEPDSQGRVMGDARVLDAMVSSLTGEYQLWVRRNAVATAESRQASASERDEPQASPETEQARKQEHAAQIAELRATYDAALSESMANAQP